MSLRQTAQADVATILGDSVTGFGWPIKITSPEGVSADLTGFSTDIGLAIDPDTGQVVSGRTASVSLMMSAISGAGYTSLPRGVSDQRIKPWIIEFNDIGGIAYKFKVSRSIPDHAIGSTVLLLEIYK